MTDDDDDCLPWFDTGTSYELSREERPRFRSVSPAAHRALEIGRINREREKREAQRGPVGFHRVR